MPLDPISAYREALNDDSSADHPLANATQPITKETHNLSQIIAATIYQSPTPVPPRVLYNALQHFELIPATPAGRARATAAVYRLTLRNIIVKLPAGLAINGEAIKAAGLPQDFIPPAPSPNPVPNLPPYPLSPAPLPLPPAVDERSPAALE